jgi:predicted PurR-regulated permease PerM
VWPFTGLTVAAVVLIKDEVLTRVGDTIHATIYGMLFCALIQGPLGGLMFWILGLPAPVFWGLVMAVLAVVPYLGSFLIWAPAAVYLVMEGNWVKGLVLVVWGLVIVGLSDNLIYPILVGKRMRLHTLPVLIAIVGGMIVFGAAGVILGPVILAVTDALLEIWRRRTAGGQRVEEPIRKEEDGVVEDSAKNSLPASDKG